ncbi:phospholipase/carboxylesterase [Pseudoxanthomonas sp. GM95]|uniref:alpha/beta hydrolase n=1 Tax=Pseudoxanthomonas sp. GM95 TaxID=1881043 RepID=UPI0008C58B40|nr:carboxylesterase [Pseudoxanthomonas sp. GM95]SEK53967.1 phospholipase/carboxylesterase [Pseudoxanthomonas sp. GM95]
MSDLLDTVELETGAAPQWTVLWLHGLGADGNDFAPIVPELVRPGWPALRFVFPHAPVRAVTINNGMRMRAWYDIAGTDFATRADAAGVDESIVQVEALITREAARGIDAAHILLAGFSQGGAITLAAGARRSVPLAGLIALSTYLPAADALAGFAHEAARTQPIFMGHGTADPVVLPEYGQRSAQALTGEGFSIDWHTYPMGHSVCAEEIRDLGDWMSQRFS